jgi:D-alanyl-D-alanine carboxypeptidase
MPVLASDASFPILSAQGVIAVDGESGVTLYEKNGDLKLLPASTTKIMTALVSLENYNLSDVVKVGRVNVEGQKMGLVEGEQMTFSDILDGLLIYSSNDAAEVLAANYPGGREAFVLAMNKKAMDLNLNNTHFANPSGLDELGQVTTARDMVRLSQIAMQNPHFAQVVGTKQKTVKSIDGRFTHDLKNINQLLGKVDGVLGVKTGWTENARENLITYVDRGGKKVLIAVLGSQDRFGETKEIIDWVYSSYAWQPAPFYKEILGQILPK